MTMRIRLVLSVSILLLALAACAPLQPAPEPKPALPAAAVPAVESQPGPQLSSPAAAVESAPRITRANLTRLAPHTLALPAYPERVLWPAPVTPGAPEGAALLVHSEDRLYPVAFDPAAQPVLALLEPLVLPLNGNTVVAIAPDASSLLVQEPGRLALYTIGGRLLREIGELERTGWAAYSPDSSALAITSQEEFAAFVYAPDGSITKLTGFETAAPVYGAALGPGGKTMAWLSRGTLQLHDVTAVPDGLGARLDFTGFIGPVAFSPGGERLALDVEGDLYLYSAADGALLANVPLDAPLGSLAFSPDGDLLVAPYGTGFQTWDARTLEPLVTLPGGELGATWVGFSPDGRALITLHSGESSYELRAWWVE